MGHEGPHPGFEQKREMPINWRQYSDHAQVRSRIAHIVEERLEAHKEEFTDQQAVLMYFERLFEDLEYPRTLSVSTFPLENANDPLGKWGIAIEAISPLGTSNELIKVRVPDAEPVQPVQFEQPPLANDWANSIDNLSIERRMRRIVEASLERDANSLRTGEDVRHHLEQLFENLGYPEPLRVSAIHLPSSKTKWQVHITARSPVEGQTPLIDFLVPQPQDLEAYY